MRHPINEVPLILTVITSDKQTFPGTLVIPIELPDINTFQFLNDKYSSSRLIVVRHHCSIIYIPFLLPGLFVDGSAQQSLNCILTNQLISVRRDWRGSNEFGRCSWKGLVSWGLLEDRPRGVGWHLDVDVPYGDLLFWRLAEIYAGFVAHINNSKMQLPSKFTEDTTLRQFFSQPDNKFNYLTYKQFCSIFPIDKNYVHRVNRAIVDIHLRFHNHVFEQMAPYKWTPIVLWTLFKVIRVRSPPLIMPLVWLHLFDYYFYEYFAWRERDKNLINIRNSFNFKLSRPQNLTKKLRIANNYLQIVSSKERSEPPAKYLAFDEYSPYLYSSNQIDKQESQVYLTNLFGFYARLKAFSFKDFKAIYKDIGNHLKEYKQFMKKWRNAKNSETKYKSDFKELLSLTVVNPEKIAGFIPQVQEQISAFQELWRYHLTGVFEKKAFSFKQFYEIKQDMKPINIRYKYRLEDNWQGLSIYYSLIAVPWLFAKLLKR